jgi:hypothetical protein
MKLTKQIYKHTELQSYNKQQNTELVEAKRRELRNSGSRSAEDSSRSKDKA